MKTTQFSIVRRANFFCDVNMVNSFELEIVFYAKWSSPDHFFSRVLQENRERA
jgi:hypothetical protein